MSRWHTFAIGVSLLAACSAPEAPDTPSWTEDVRPILAANCVRCHGYPATNGAPTSFRLDRYADTVTDDGRTVRGAGAVSEFVAARTAEGTMPPRFAIADWQVETLQNWFALKPAMTGEPPPAGDPAAGNQPPEMRRLRATQEPSTGEVAIEWEIRDPDGDIVGGVLRAEGPGEPVTVTRELRAGRGTTVWDAGVVEAGTWSLTAEIDDGAGPVEVDLGTIEVSHVGDNVAPSVSVGGVGRHDILADDGAPHEILVEVDDPDTGDVHTATVTATLGDQTVTIADGEPVLAGLNTIAWDTTAVPAGDAWRLEVTVDDGSATRTATVEPVVVGHQATDLTFDDVAIIFQTKCIGCHPGADRLPGLPWNFSVYSSDETAGVYDLRGLIYWRVVRQANMPPPSASLFTSAEAQLTDDEVATLEEWLLAGAPE